MVYIDARLGVCIEHCTVRVVSLILWPVQRSFASITYVKRKADLVAALQEMIEAEGPFLLDVEVPYQEHVLPMIPANGSVENLIRDSLSQCQ